MKPLTFFLAGSTQNSVTAAEGLVTHPEFTCAGVLTPAARPVGREQTLTATPVQTWAESNQLPVITLENKIDINIKEQLLARSQPDFLLVVDFGYLVPQWLLDWPRVAPINIHPSELPRWRGSSPGQMVLLYGEPSSAVTIMQMDAQLDHGPILKQLPFTVNPTWTQVEYYQHSFELAQAALAPTLVELVEGKLRPQPQPDDSPTPKADHLNKTESFVSWSVIEAVLKGQEPRELAGTSPLLQTTQAATGESWPKVLARASRAFYPWPQLWSLAPTSKGARRLKIHSCHIEGARLILDQVQLEGQQPAPWNQIKNAINLA